MSFHDLCLDPRLLRAVLKRGFDKPTPVQEHAIPQLLEGKDVVARARTGSGKTFAYLLPALHRILSSPDFSGGWRALILVPTKELCEQVKQEVQSITDHCGEDIKATTLVAEHTAHLQQAIAEAGQVVISTPGKLGDALRGRLLTGEMLEGRLGVLVLDEADLLLSCGYEEDLQLLAPVVPRSCQCILMSATSSPDVERLQKLVLHNPVALNLLSLGSTPGAAGLGAGSGTSAEIEHFAVQCGRDDRLLFVMALLKLSLVHRKVLLFVNTVAAGFKLRLFLESFGIRAALLNAELPLNSRSHILHCFNKGLFDYLIATDDVHGTATAVTEAAAVEEGEDGKRKKKRRKREAAAPDKRRGAPKKDEEFGVTRGIDFKGVKTIINFDLPTSIEGYVHRVGRTGRGGEAGVAVSLFCPEDVELKGAVEAALAEDAAEAREGGASTSGRRGGGGDDGGEGHQRSKGLRPFSKLTKAGVEALRYRAEDVARGITKSVVREARAKDLRQELLNSVKLKSYFEEHDAEKQLLKHDRELHKKPQAAHLKHIPAYMQDPAMVGAALPRGGRLGGYRPPVNRMPRAGDPLKAVGFVKGGHKEDEMTDMEKNAAAFAKKHYKKKGLGQGGKASGSSAAGNKRRR